MTKHSRKRELTSVAEPDLPPQELENAASLNAWKAKLWTEEERVRRNVIVECGWGRLIFAHTFDSNEVLADVVKAESDNQRDIALYVGDPHIVIALAPQELFLDPSHTFRLYFERRERSTPQPTTYRVRPLESVKDAEAINLIYARRHMVEVDPSFIHSHKDSLSHVYLVAEDRQTNAIIGTVTGIDHTVAFNDPEQGSSLWALAVDPQTQHPGVGEALVLNLVEHFTGLGRRYIDLSVMHDNRQAIRLYEKLGFMRVPVFCIKNKNEINEPLFLGNAPEDLNPYAKIITREAQRRGVHVHVLDAEHSYFCLSFGGRNIVCRESLSELTSAIAMSRCDDKRVTHRLLTEAGLAMPAQVRVSDGKERYLAFLEQHRRVVVKPARGEQGAGVSVGISTLSDLKGAIERAGQGGGEVLIEEMVSGQDLRIIVIDYRVVAAAIRRPPEVVGDAEHSIRDLVERQSRRRQAATGGESSIPLDAETERCLAEAGHRLDDVLPLGKTLTVRKAANLHTGGTIHDVTDELHPHLVEVAKRAAEVLDIPVVGLDLMVPSVLKPEYWIIEANERPGLANHEPQPTAQRFLDLLFPQTVSTS